MTSIEDELLFETCKAGDISFVRHMIRDASKYGVVYDWDFALGGACEGGNEEIVNLIINNGAIGWNFGMECASEFGHMKIVKLMISKGANSWNWSLIKACENDHLEIARLMIEKGANNIKEAISCSNTGEILMLLSKHEVN